MTNLDPRVAVNTGLIAGLLLEAHRNGMFQLVPVPRVDADGFTGVIDLMENGATVMTVTVEEQAG